MDTTPLCQLLEWDSAFFGRRIGRVFAQRLSQATMTAIETWATAHQIDCLYFLAEIDDSQTHHFAEMQGFRLMDIRLTFGQHLLRDSHSPPPIIAGIGLRLAQPTDVPALKTLAGQTYEKTRFFNDPNFSMAQCQALYGTWIEKSCQGYADAVWVADEGQQILGYITVKRTGDQSGEIGLVGVSDLARNRGLGKALVGQALNWFAERNILNLTVVTQGSNRGAQRLYQRTGFQLDDVQVWFHRWFTQP